MNGITRRALLGSGIAAGVATASGPALANPGGVKPGDPLAAPFSAGTNRPAFHVPHGAVDSHDRSIVAAAFVRSAPERMVWGSDWPHPSASRGEVPMPNDTDLFDMFAGWASDHRTIKQILVRNPRELYDF